MQTPHAITPAFNQPTHPLRADASAALMPASHTLAHYQIMRRNGAVVAFEPSKIAVAMMKAFLAVHGTQGAASASVRRTGRRSAVDNWA